MKKQYLLYCLTFLVLAKAARAQDPVTDNGNKVAAYLLDAHKNSKTKKTAWKFDFALAWEQIPAITNTTSADGVINPYSTYDVISLPAATTGLQFWYNPASFVSLRLKSALTYGVPISSGQSGDYFDYSGNVKLLLGTKVKVFGEAGYISRTGDYTLDQDASNASLGISTSDGITTTGTFDYTVTRVGGGLYFETSKESDSYIELGVFKENTSLASNGTKVNNAQTVSPLVYKATFVFGKFFMEGSYSSNYPLDGSALYNIDSQGAAQKSFLEFKLGAIFTL